MNAKVLTVLTKARNRQNKISLKKHAKKKQVSFNKTTFTRVVSRYINSDKKKNKKDAKGKKVITEITISKEIIKGDLKGGGGEDVKKENDVKKGVDVKEGGVSTKEKIKKDLKGVNLKGGKKLEMSDKV